MSRFADNIVPHAFQYGEMPPEKRRSVLPERNVCSLFLAKDYDDAFTTGDGFQRLDALGDPYCEELAFSHEALYEPQWAHTPEPPDLTGVMPDVRRLMLQGKLAESAELVEKAQFDAGFGPDFIYIGPGGKEIIPPRSLHKHKAFWLGIRQNGLGETRDYLRWLDLMNGKFTVQWENSRGAFKREAFVAYKGDVAVLRLTATEGALDAQFTMRLPISGDDDTFPSGITKPELCSHELDIAEDLFTLKWAYYPEYGRKGFVSVVRFVRSGGKAEKVGSGVLVSGADSVLILAKTVKFEGNFSFACDGPIVDEILAMDPDFDSLLQYNREYIGSRMERSRIRLGRPEDFALSAEELLRRTHSEVEFDPTLLEKLYDMGRFFQIIDTGAIPPMKGQHNINTNLQVCSGNNTGLFDEMDVYFRYYESKFEDFRTNARKLFGARGLLASIHCDYDSGLMYHFSKTYPHYCWTGCLGWVYNELWGYWLVSGDREFLRTRLVPALKEIALFFEDYARDRGPDGRSIFYPSFSPENPTPAFTEGNNVYAASINSVMDVMICREVLDNLITACGVLGIEKDNVPHWQAQMVSLPRYLLDEEGGLKEWAWPTIGENYDHRHVSHHYDLWPGRAVTWEEEPELADAIRISNRKRAQQNDSAHGIIHRLFSAIRLKDLPETEQNLYQLMNHGFVTRALQTYHYPYRTHFPDLQGSMPAILLEMAVYSAPGTVEFLPAMPDSLGTGVLEGVWLYTWAKLEHMEWNETGVKAKLVSNRAQTLSLRCRRPGASFRVGGGTVPMQGDHIRYGFAEGEAVEIELAF